MDEIMDVKPRVHVKMEQIQNPPKGETRTAIATLKIQQDKNKNEQQDQKQGEKNKQEVQKQVQKEEQQKKEETQQKQNILIKTKQISAQRQMIKFFMQTKPVQYIIILLTTIYTIIIFTTLAIDDLFSEDESTGILYIFILMELVILIVFQVEIVLNSYAAGYNNYFRDKWLKFDAIVILFSLILVILDLSLDYGKVFKSISSVIRGIFRFLRIFLLIRKVQIFKQIKTSSSIKTPAEKIIEMLSEIREFFDTENIIEDIEWSINMIASNKLYEPVIIKGSNENGDVANWINYGARNQEVNKNEEDMQLKRQNSAQRNPNRNLLKQLNAIPIEVTNLMKDIDEIFFDCFELERVANGQELYYTMVYLFETNNILSTLDINPQKLSDYFKKIQEGYQNNQYHNRLHAFDVLQTSNFFLKKCKFIELAEINNLELCAIYIASAAHDYDHPGKNNSYLINTSHELAILYNDQSVLENHHASSVFQLMKDEDTNILESFTNEQFKKFREMVISIILSTDMAKHFTDIAKIKGRLGAPDFSINNKDKQICIDMVVHACDISNPIKPWLICQQWTFKVLEEFWQQGDAERERGIPITYLCDRYTVNVSKSQIGFIDFIVKPLYEVVVIYLPQLQSYIPNLESNKGRWTEQIQKWDDDLKQLKEKEDEKQKQENQK